MTDPKKDMLDPAIEGTLNVVRSAHKAGVRRIIITSSFVAVCDVALGGSVQQKLVVTKHCLHSTPQGRGATILTQPMTGTIHSNEAARNAKMLIQESCNI